MPLFHNHIGIFVSQTKLQLVEIVYTGEKFVLENIDEEYFDDFLNFDEKETKVISIMQNALNEIIVRKPLKSKNISFALPHSFFRTAKIPFEPKLNQNEMLEHFKWEYSHLYPKNSPEELIFQFMPVISENDKKSDFIIVVAALKKYLKIFYKFAKLNDLKLKYFDNAHFSVDRILNLDTSISNNEKIISVYISENSISFSEIQNGKTCDFKIQFYSNVNEITGIISNEINSRNEISNAKIFVNGTVSVEAVKRKIENEMNFQIINFNPLEKLSSESGFEGKEISHEKYLSFLTAASVAFRIT